MEKPRKGSKGGRLTIYEDSFKILVARDYLSGNLSQLQIAKKYGLAEGSIYYFLNWYKRHHSEVPQAVQSSSGTSATEPELARQLAEAKLKITALELLLSNAEREMGVNIIKKSGTKRSGK
jgi:transposase-like protein